MKQLERLMPYITLQAHSGQYMPESPYALAWDGRFLESLELAKDGERVWITPQNGYSRAIPLDQLNQVQVWKCELVE